MSANIVELNNIYITDKNNKIYKKVYTDYEYIITSASTANLAELEAQLAIKNDLISHLNNFIDKVKNIPHFKYIDLAPLTITADINAFFHAINTINIITIAVYKHSVVCRNPLQTDSLSKELQLKYSETYYCYLYKVLQFNYLSVFSTMNFS